MPCRPTTNGNSKKIKSKAVKPKHNTTGLAVSPTQLEIASPRGQLPFELQQLLLNIFKNAFSTSFSPDLTTVIQQVKQTLFRRDFGTTFGTPSFLEAYAIRWSASRSLVYLEIFKNLPQLFANLISSPSQRSCELEKAAELGEDTSSPSLFSGAAIETVPSTQRHIPDEFQVVTRVVCVGGGAGAEVVALAGYLSLLNSTSCASVANEKAKAAKLNLTAIDIADWSSIVLRLYSGITASPPLPKYASPTVQATNTLLVDPKTYDVHFMHHDILKMDEEVQKVLKEARLVTLMFTLNELYSTSMSATMNMLLSMTSLLAAGSLLLVVDSPGSYSTVNVGCKNSLSENDPSVEPKKYPMQWLLDHTLLEAAKLESSENRVPNKQWERLYSSDSTWFRLPAGLTYPIALEDMRYQAHLYRRL